MGFVGHWCGGVLIGEEWALTGTAELIKL